MNKPELDRPYLVGENIYLRALEIEDVDKGYLQWINDHEVIKYLETAHFPKTRSSLIKYVENIENTPNVVFFSIIEKSTGRYIGNAKLGPISWINSNAEYGRMIGAKEAWGKGYGKEVARLLLRYGFEVLGLNKITAGALVDNQASIKSNEKIGLRIEGCLKEQTFHEGKFKDSIRMGITRREYNKLYLSII